MNSERNAVQSTSQMMASDRRRKAKAREIYQKFFEGTETVSDAKIIIVILRELVDSEVVCPPLKQSRREQDRA